MCTSIIHLVELMELLTELDNLIGNQSQNIPNHIWTLGENVVNDCLVPKFEAGVDRPLELSDFEAYRSINHENVKKVEACIQKIVQLLVNNKDAGNKQSAKSKFLTSILILCGEMSAESHWCTNETVKCTEAILSHTCKLTHCDNVSEVLVGNKYKYFANYPMLFKPVLLTLRPQLLKETWKIYPASVSCFMWLLFQVKSPYLSEHINHVLPTALILADDFIPDNTAIGIKCLHHIADNVTRTDLNFCGDVIYSAVKHCLYNREHILVKCVICCLVVVLKKVEQSYDKTEYCVSWCKYDECLNIILNNMELNQNFKFREAYIQSLYLYIKDMPLCIINWCDRLLSVLEEYLQSIEYASRTYSRYSILSFHMLLVKVWPRIQHHSKKILKILARFVYDVQSIQKQHGNEQHDIEELLQISKECLGIMWKLATKSTKKDCSDFMQINNLDLLELKIFFEESCN